MTPPNQGLPDDEKTSSAAGQQPGSTPAPEPKSGEHTKADEAPKEQPPKPGANEAVAEALKARGRPKARETRREHAAGDRYFLNYGNVFLDKVRNDGTIVGRDQWKEAAGVRSTQVVVASVPAAELTAALEDRGDQGFYPKAREILLRNRVCVLMHGRWDFEKRRGALSLLMALAAQREHQTVDEIAPGTHLEQLIGFDFAADRGYLLTVTREEVASRIERFTLDRIRDEMERAKSRLVVIVAGDVRLGVDGMGDYGVSCVPDVEAWFSSDRTLADNALIIGVAVLGGASHQAIVDAADRLHRSLTKIDVEDSVRSHLFGRTGTARLREVKAHAEHAEEKTEFGSIPVKVVEFDDQQWYSAVLEYLWDEQDLLRGPLLDWMRILCTDADVDVRVRAASAIGELCRHDFGYVWQQVIERWAQEDDEMLRRAAASAAGIPAWQEGLTAHVGKALELWAADDSDWRLRWTATAAYGSYWLGRRFPAEAISAFEGILRDEDARDLWPIGAESLAGFFELGRQSDEYYGRVLHALLRWSDQAEKSKVMAISGLMIFLNLAYESEMPGDAEEGGGWPTLLWLLENDLSLQDTILNLWRRCLFTRFTRDPAAEVLEEWIKGADKHVERYSAIERLVARLAATDREWQRLRFYIARWARRRDTGSPAATRLLATLTGDRSALVEIGSSRAAVLTTVGGAGATGSEMEDEE